MSGGGFISLGGGTATPISGGTMYMLNNVTTLDVEQDAPTGLRLFTAGTLQNWTFNAGSYGTISAFADAGGGMVSATSTAHGLVTGDFVTIRNSLYLGLYEITKVDNDTFKFTAVFGATGTANWDQGSYLQVGAGGIGKYTITYWITANEGAGEIMKFVPYQNTTSVVDAEKTETFNGVIKQVSGYGIVDVVEGDRIFLTARAGGPVTMSPTSAEVILTKI